MTLWQLIFSQSKVNNSLYERDKLAIHNWLWPRGTWLQKRLRYLRKKQQIRQETGEEGNGVPPVGSLPFKSYQATPETGFQRKDGSYGSFTCADASNGENHLSRSSPGLA